MAMKFVDIKKVFFYYRIKINCKFASGELDS